MNALLLPSLLLGCVAAEPPESKVPVGKETTYATGPIDKHGYIDYEAALNDLLGKGISPDKNANVLLWKAFGPAPEGGKGMPPEFFKRLGIDEPPEGGDYFIDLTRYMKDHLQLDPNDFQTVHDQQSRASRRPWTAQDYPDIAAWLKANAKPLSLVVEATKRPAYFNPLCSHRGADDPSSLLGCLLPGVQKCRELATALTGRAMLRLGEGKPDEAWQDLLACHRLARHITRGATLIETLVGIAVHQVACNATIAYLERADLSSKQVLDRLKELRALPPLAPMADKIDRGERLMCLDSFQLIRRGEIDGQKPTPEERQALDMIDWEPALRNVNKQYDRMAAAMRLKDRADREKELDTIERDLEALVKKNRDLNKLLKEKAPGKVIGQEIGDVLLALLAPAIRKVQSASDRAEQVERNLHLAFALAAYRADTGRYPEKLSELAPKYLSAVPGDLFSGKALIYKPSEKGYLCYSVGPNGKDDGGRWFDDDPPGDDPGVRMPLPELKKK
jgi:hypothetical protein